MDDEDRSNYKSIFDHYYSLLSKDMSDYTNRIKQLQLPIIPMPILIKLLHNALDIFKSEPIIIHTVAPYAIVGDLHGQILDLLRIIQAQGPPPQTRYIFLGDLVDRGQFSTETVTLVFIMKVLWPESVILVRGNHEFDELCSIGGFHKELTSLYNSEDLNRLFSSTFACLPIACIINDAILCLHGGIGPLVHKLNEIEKTERPLYVFPDGPVTDILWSDPSEIVDTFKLSSRGSGALFGQKALDSFLENESLELLVRGHQCVASGVATSLKGKCITVFSASNYCGVTGNKSGILLISENGLVTHQSFDPLALLPRFEASFISSQSESVFTLPSTPQLTPLPMLSVTKDFDKQRSTGRSAHSSLLIKKSEPNCHTGREENRSPIVFNNQQKKTRNVLPKSKPRRSMQLPMLKRLNPI